MWYEDPEAQETLRSIGLQPTDEPGRWVSENGMREVVDFDGGIAMTTRILPDDDRFDVTTITQGSLRGVEFLSQAFKEHSAEIRRRTEELQEKGAAALSGRGSKN